MPQVPDFVSTQPYDFTPQPGQDPSAAAAPGQALARGADQLSGQFDDLTSRYAELAARQKNMQDAVTASNISTNYAVALNKQRLVSASDPDWQNAPQKFQDAGTALQSQMIPDGTDPRVAQIATQQMNQHLRSYTIDVQNKAHETGRITMDASLQTDNSNREQLAVSAPNPLEFDQQVAAISGANQSAVAGGLINPLQARLRTSGSLRNIFLQRALTDPVGAQQLLKQYGALMTSQDTTMVAEHLEPKVQRATSDAAASSIWAGSGPGAPGAMSGDLETFVKGQEGFSATPYADGAQTSIGYGTKAQPGDSQITPEEGVNRLRGELGQSAATVDAAAGKAGIGLTTGQRNALISFDYNTGKGASVIADSGGDASKIPALMAPYTHQGAKELPSLVNRRRAEIAMFNGGGGSNGAADPLAIPAGDPTAAPTEAAANPQAGFPDLPKMLTQAATIADPTARAQVEAGIRQRYNTYLAQTAQQREQMGSTVANTVAALNNGVDVDAPAESDVRAVFPPKQADKIMGQLQAAQQTNLAVKSIALASPDQVATIRQQAADDVGALSAKPAKASPVSGAPPTAPTWTPGTDGLIAAIAKRNAVETAVAQRQKALSDDPAAYVASRDPTLQPLAAAAQANPNDPAARIAFANASKASQARLGVPADQQSYLTNSDVKSLADRLGSVDPATANMGAALDAMGKSYGDGTANNLWPQVFGELVRKGNISPSYQTLGAMTDPSQAVARQDLQRALVMTAQKGGVDALKKDASPVAKDIESGLDGTMSQFRDAYGFNPGGLDAISTMRNSVEQLALYYGAQGASASDALSRAYNGVFAGRFDAGGGRNGTIIAPKGQLSAVAGAASGVQANLKAEDLAPLPDTTTGMRTVGEQRESMLALSRDADWRPNQDASGLVLIGNGRDGSHIPIRRADGSKIEIKFNALPQVQQQLGSGIVGAADGVSATP